MDDQGTWPTPLPPKNTSEQQHLNQKIMDDMRTNPEAIQQIAGVKGSIWVLLAPIIALALLIPAWLQWRSSNSNLWLVVIAIIVMTAALLWVSRLKALFTQARNVMSTHLATSVGYGVGVIRTINFPDQKPLTKNTEHTHDVPTTDVELTLAVSPTQGQQFTARTTQHYATVDALQLEIGQHGPVHYLRRDPENTTDIATGLDPDAVQKIYRAAALN